jgi:hypothetical protein
VSLLMTIQRYHMWVGGSDMAGRGEELVFTENLNAKTVEID